jgi:pimeloyl-ACP methyl ester carboxylesterase
MRAWLSALLLAALLAGCGRRAPASPTPAVTLPAVEIVTSTQTPVPTATGPVPTVARPTPAAPVALAITAPDRTQLAAGYYAPVVFEPVAGGQAPGVVLVHMLGGSRADWDGLARDLQSAGFAVLALDLRGHGGSPGPEDWEKSIGDVAAAWQALRARSEVDPDRTALVGASIGANLVLIVGANNAGVAAVAALSPGGDYHGLKPQGLLPNFGNRPVYLLASQDDPAAYASAQAMVGDLSAGEAFYYQAAGHGTAMLDNPDVGTRLLNWLGVKLGEAKG